MATYYWSGGIDSNLDVPGNFVDGDENPLTVVPGEDDAVEMGTLANVANSPQTGTSDADWHLESNSATIDGGTFNGGIFMATGGETLYAGTFNGVVTGIGIIEGGTFNEPVSGFITIAGNYGAIFNASVEIDNAPIHLGTFNGPVSVNYEILDGTFNGSVDLNGIAAVYGGTFHGLVDATGGAYISGGNFYGDLIYDSNSFFDQFPHYVFANTTSLSKGGVTLYGPSHAAVADPADVRAGVTNLGVAGELDISADNPQPVVHYRTGPAIALPMV